MLRGLLDVVPQGAVHDELFLEVVQALTCATFLTTATTTAAAIQVDLFVVGIFWATTIGLRHCVFGLVETSARQKDPQ